MRLLSEGWDVPAARDVRDSQNMPSSILLVGSSGGHLAQLVALRPWWATRERTWVTFQTEDARSKLREENVVWAYHPTTRHIPNMLRNLRLAVTILRRTRPDVVVSTGAGVAVPFFLIARLLGIPTVYLEVYDRLDSATLTGKLCRPLSTLFCVQWEEQRDLYKDAEVVGTLL
jgi:UDP-N-acetylglucosamine:LPS N-acetylglucosamine transferase